MRGSAALAILLLAPSTAFAQEGTVTATDPGTVVAALQTYGHKARLETDDSGNPMIAARGGDIHYVVYFYGCENGGECLDLQFLAHFAVELPLTADFSNRWNAERVLGKVFVDENGDPTITFVLPATPGVPPEYFASVLQVWTIAVDSFAEEIDW